MADSPHFESPANWSAAAALVTFVPFVPRFTSGGELRGLRVHVRDHKRRELSIADRTLEAYYGVFTLSQSRKSVSAARHSALEVSYGRDPRPITVQGCEGRAYELGPEPAPDDIDGRSPSVVVWADGEMVYFLASSELGVMELLRVAESIAR